MVNLGPLASYTHSTVKSLGVLFDRAFNFEKLISSVVRGSRFALRQIAKVKAYLPQKDLERICILFDINTCILFVLLALQCITYLLWFCCTITPVKHFGQSSCF